MDEKTQYAIKVMLDDITFMLFDLEMGGHIDSAAAIVLNENYSIYYERITTSEELLSDRKNIISNFTIRAYYNQSICTNFEVHGEAKMFRVYEVDGFLTGMLLNTLDSYRKQKFGVI